MIQNQKNPLSLTLKITITVFFGILTIAIWIHQGAIGGIFSGTLFSLFLYRNVLNSRPKTGADILYEPSLEIERDVVRPYTKQLIYIFIIILIADVILYALTRNVTSLLTLFFLEILALVSYYLFQIQSIHRYRDNQAKQDAAQEIGFTFSPTRDITAIHEKIRAIGSNPQITNIFTGNLQGFPCMLFDFHYVWMKKASYEVTILEITNEKLCPNMLIISKSHSFGNTFNLSAMFPGIPVTLEGSFSKYFSLFVERGSEDEIRQILPPDLMATLIDDMPDLSFLFFDNKVYVILGNDTGHGFSKDNFVAQIAKANAILDKWSLTLTKMTF
jgi:hypothetical protein